MTTSTNNYSNPFSENELKSIFKIKAGNPPLMKSRESSRLEFRETFSLDACKSKLRTFAAFANNQGGYFIFGVKDAPRVLLGLTGKAFVNLKTEKLTEILNEHFAPKIGWDAHEYECEEMVFGLIYVHTSHNKPVLCLKNCSAAKCKEGEIYYRYRGRTQVIKYPELQKIFEEVRAQERDLCLKHLSKISRIGVKNAAVMDSVTGEVTGRSGSFLIDQSLVSKIAFIREGQFTESKAAPTLKLIGDVEVIDSHLIQPTKQVIRRTKGINLPDIVNAFLDQEDVPDAAEYISAICYQTAATLPVYWFMLKGKLSLDDVIGQIDSSQSTSQARKYLKKRINDVLANGKCTKPSQQNNTTRQEDCQEVLNQMLANSPNADILVPVIKAVLTLNSAEIDPNYLFPLLKAWFENSYSGMDTNTQSLFRRVLVHLDTTLYAHKVVTDQPATDGSPQYLRPQDH